MARRADPAIFALIADAKDDAASAASSAPSLKLLSLVKTKGLDELDKTVCDRFIVFAAQHKAVRNSILFHWRPIQRQTN